VVATPPRCREVFREIDPDFEAGSLDEAFLDVTDYCAARGLTGERSTEEKKGR
jgi:DNA polymerase kappa